MAKPKITTVDEYIQSFPEEIQERLKQVREAVNQSIPNADEALKWSRPAYVDERILVMFAGFKNHIGFYSTPSSLAAFERELAKFKTGKGSVQLPHKQSLPLDLIRELTSYRAWESSEKNVKWKS